MCGLLEQWKKPSLKGFTEFFAPVKRLNQRRPSWVAVFSILNIISNCEKVRYGWRLFVMNRMQRFVFISLLVLAGPTQAALEPKAAARQIDALLESDWKKHDLKGNPEADANTFVRRIYLDVIGRIPTTRETEEFLASKDSDKRSKLIDKLLASEGYAQHFFNYWADVLRAQSNGNQAGAITGAAYTNFLKQSLRDNKPYDQLVREMVAAQGKAWETGAIGYYMRDRGMPLDNMANTVRVFLGTRVECAQCHNHPFDKWTQMQFYKMAAFTYGVETQDYNGGTMGGVRDLLKEQEDTIKASFKEPQRPRFVKGMEKQTYARLEENYRAEYKDVQKKREEARQKIRKEQRNYQESMRDISDTMRYTSVSTRNRKVTLPHDYQYPDAKPKSVVEPGAMMGHECITQPGETPLQAYARWMTGKDNPRFTTVIVNRLWKKAFGLALIEPLDELMDGTVPMNPQMQKHLEQLIVEMNYDMKGFLRVLFNTNTYQRQVTHEDVAQGVVYHFTGPLLRRMSAEQMWDSFVTLINPRPDMINVAAREQMDQRVQQARKIADGVDSLTPEEALRGVKLAAAVYDKNRERTDAKQKEYLAARMAQKEMQEKVEALKGEERKAGDLKLVELKKKVDQIRSEVNAIQNEGRRVSTNEIIVPGEKKLYEQVTGKPYQNVAMKTNAAESNGAPSMMAGESMTMMAYGVKAEKVTIPGYDRKESTPEDKKAEAEQREAAYQEEAQFFGIPEKEWKSYFKSRAEQSRNWLRSAEIESPAPRGHYLREFGQSDRETIENANNEASVPQALALMNGQLLPQILSKYSQLMLTLSKAPYPDDKVDAAYLSLLSRKPTTKEKNTWLKAQEKGLTTYEDLIFSLLNTQQFIFVQ